jgi:hypothetical protein
MAALVTGHAAPSGAVGGSNRVTNSPSAVLSTPSQLSTQFRIRKLDFFQENKREIPGKYPWLRAVLSRLYISRVASERGRIICSV